MMNREVFQRDPTQEKLLNDGQARIHDSMTDLERKTLRWELSNFACEGKYADGLVRILDSYLKNVGKTSQPAAWVSGFFGSGKSHLLKMVAHLWVNTEFPEDHSTARGLVPKLPREAEAALKELDIQGRRHGGLHAAAGTLPSGGGRSVRLAVLEILLRSLGLPESYPQARFWLYLRDKGFLDPVIAFVRKQKKDILREMNDLYVSPLFHDALIEADPGFKDRQTVRELLKQQFPQRDDITTTEFIQTFREALSRDKEIPCTAIILDEVQQYIGDSSDRAVQVMEVAEALCKQMDSRVMLVGAGQTALTGTPLLQKLRDRFVIPIQLADADVESVTRKVLLEKRPDKVDAIRKALEANAGEIDRELAGTSIGPRSEDRSLWIEDYPLLPVRRRFWEHVFRAVDTAGTAAMLRSQLRIIYEALRATAEDPVGTVVPADFMFDQLQPILLQQGVLLREIDETIRRLDDGTQNGRLARRLCGLVFLIRKLPRDPKVDIGVRATLEMLPDLLVSDLGADGVKLRKDVPRVLKDLVSKGILLDVDGEYNLQTRESVEWDKEFRIRQGRLAGNESEIQVKRDALIRAAFNEAIKGFRLQHGESKEHRHLAPHFGEDAPPPATLNVPVWIRDGWECSEKEVLNHARAAGPDSPVVFAFIPRVSSEDLKRWIVDADAAKATLDFKGAPNNREGQDARDAMDTRMRGATAQRDNLVKEIINKAKVFKGGGTELFDLVLEEKIEGAARDAIERLFPRFKEGDHKSWATAIARAKNGDDSPLQVVDWTAPADQHPVCKEVLREVGAGKDGRSIRRKFGESPYGWPQDAIDGALIVLHAAGHLQARHKGASLASGQLDQNKIAVSDFRVEAVTLTAGNKIVIRGVFQEAGIPVRPSDDLDIKGKEFMDRFLALLDMASGPAPMPERPAPDYLEDLRTKSGNERLAVILGNAKSIRKDLVGWKAAADLAKERRPLWDRLESLLRHATCLPAAGDLRLQAEAIRKDRLLLDATDRVTPLVKKAAEMLRAAVSEALLRHKRAHDDEMERLEANEAWKRIGKEQRQAILAEENIAALPAPAIGSDDELMAVLDAAPLASWREKTDALPQRFRNASMKAARQLEPKIQHVRLASGTLKSQADVKEWVARQEADLLDRLKDGPIVIG